jgi:phenylacetate-CoA ligase
MSDTNEDRETGTSLNEKYWVARKFYESLLRSERLPTHKIEAYQATQLQQLLAHTAKQVPYYRSVLSGLRKSDGTFDLTRWPEIPLVSRQEVIAHWESFQSEHLPAGHQSVLESTTSGSEGTALTMRKTRFEHTGVACASYRYAQWFSYDYKIPLAMIRAGFIRTANPDDPEDQRWGPPWIPPEQRSARYRLNIQIPIEEQLEWLLRLGRVYLNTLPSNAMALAQLSAETGLKPSLAGILTVGERLSSDVCHEVKSILGTQISDVYATAECGLLAIECPQSQNYHVQSEITKVEVLKADGEPCLPGETGHVVATSLYNYAMPIIRYRFKDLVTVGGPCSCGRDLPVISKILGREKGLFRLADGSLMLPDFRTERIRQLAGTSHWQVAQVSPCRAEVRLRYANINDTVADAVRDYVCSVVGAKMVVLTRSVSEFPRSQGGKFYPVAREFG